MIVESVYIVTPKVTPSCLLYPFLPDLHIWLSPAFLFDPCSSSSTLLFLQKLLVAFWAFDFCLAVLCHLNPKPDSERALSDQFDFL